MKLELPQPVPRWPGLLSTLERVQRTGSSSMFHGTWVVQYARRCEWLECDEAGLATTIRLRCPADPASQVFLALCIEVLHELVRDRLEELRSG